MFKPSYQSGPPYLQMAHNGREQLPSVSAACYISSPFTQLPSTLLLTLKEAVQHSLYLH